MTVEDYEAFTDARCAEDLLAIERRRPLTEHEQRRLDMCLAASDALQLLRQLDQDFASHEPTQSDQSRIVEQCVLAARRQFTTRPNAFVSRVSLRVMLFAAPLLLFSLGAAAALYHWVPSVLTPRSAVTPSIGDRSPLQRERSVPRAPAVRDSTPDSSPSTRVAATASAPTVSSARESGSSARAARSSAPTEPRLAITAPYADTGKNASEVFSAANAARRAGDTRRAIVLYGRLQADYPQSDEALISHVLLARLALSRGTSGEALRHFDAYLARASAGALTQEVLQGKAQCLSSLGRRQEEVAVWRRLLREYPDSVYARTAREHLGQDGR
jgi:TolA-binding protein